MTYEITRVAAGLNDKLNLSRCFQRFIDLHGLRPESSVICNRRFIGKCTRQKVLLS